MAEWIPWKQQNLINTLDAVAHVDESQNHTCIFADATKVFGDERSCVRHRESCETSLKAQADLFCNPKKFMLVKCLVSMSYLNVFNIQYSSNKCFLDVSISKDLPTSLWGFNGGFSCKSLSKLNNDYKALMKALSEDMEDHPIGTIVFVVYICKNIRIRMCIGNVQRFLERKRHIPERKHQLWPHSKPRLLQSVLSAQCSSFWRTWTCVKILLTMNPIMR